MGDDFFSPKVWRTINTEEALENILLADDLCFYHTISGVESVESPAYVLPVCFDENLLCGIFNHEDRLVKTPTAFTLGKNDQQKFYYPLANFQVIDNIPKNEAVLYLPLSPTEYKTQLSRGEKLIQPEPFSILGIEGLNPHYPLALIRLSKNKDQKNLLECWGLVSDPKIGLFLYRNDAHVKQDDLVRCLNKIRYGKIKTSYSLPSPVDKLSKEEPKPIELTELLDENEEFGLEFKKELEWDKPQKVVEYLDRFVIGQEEAKKTAATAFSLYMKRVKHETGDLLLPHGHIILVGPSGIGKTLIAEKLIQRTNLPVASTSLTGKSGEGYVGESLSSVFKTIREQTEEEKPHGIVFIDEIDKVVHETRSDGFFGQLQQDQMIGWLSGTYLNVGTHDKVDRMNTENLLFFTAGAFEGLEGSRLAKIVAKRSGENVSQISGFGREKFDHKEKREILTQIIPDDLIAYGFRKELMRRLSFMGALHPLTINHKVRILKDSEDSVIKRYQNFFELEGYKLDLDEESYHLIANKSPPEIGASGLDVICQKLFFEIIFAPEDYIDGAGVIKIDQKLTKKILDK